MHVDITVIDDVWKTIARGQLNINHISAEAR